MPELAAFFTAGVIANLALTALFAFLWQRRYTRGLYRTLRLNLRKSGLYWSENQERIVRGEVETEISDRSSSLRTIWITGLLLTLLSWGGVFFQLIIMISYRFLSRSRVGKALLDSPLAHDPSLQAPQIEEWVTRLGSVDQRKTF